RRRTSTWRRPDENARFRADLRRGSARRRRGKGRLAAVFETRTVVARRGACLRLHLFDPVHRHERVAGHAGVHAVARPVARSRLLDGLVEHRLELDERRLRLFGDALRGLAALIELGEPLVVHRARAEDEGLADDDPRLRERFLRAFEEIGEALLVALDRAVVAAVQLVPDVVHADEDAQKVGRDVDRVLLPALVEIGDLVPRDAAVVDLERILGTRRKEIGSDEERVATTHRARGVRALVAAIATGIRDRVALEEDLR